MILVDKALERRARAGNPVRVGLVGAGYMGRGIALQIVTAFPGLRLAAISNRTLSGAERAYREAGITDFVHAENVAHMETAIAEGRAAVTGDALLLSEADGLDVIVEATGEIEFGARVVMKALERRKHVVLMNVELGATLGPILRTYADQNGVILTNTDGDEPGVAMNLFRFVKTIGFRPVLAGNLKGFYDPHRTPETQRKFAEEHHQKPRLITSFVDGTKLSMELTVLANATGFGVGKRGMYGPRCSHVKDALKFFPEKELLGGGLVDYLLGAGPGTGAFVVAYNQHPVRQAVHEIFQDGRRAVLRFLHPVPPPASRASVDGGPGGVVRGRNSGSGRRSGLRCRHRGEAGSQGGRSPRRDRWIHVLRADREFRHLPGGESVADGAVGGMPPAEGRSDGLPDYPRGCGASRRKVMQCASGGTGRSI